VKYVSRGPIGVWDLTEYGNYLERERGELGAHIGGANLLTIDRFIPTGPGSLHDSRFESLVISTVEPGPAGSETQILRVELRLKGPYFDRHFELRYEDVGFCSFQAPAPKDDLLMHEVWMEHGIVTHELQFDKGKTIAISCREMRFLERLNS